MATNKKIESSSKKLEGMWETMERDRLEMLEIVQSRCAFEIDLFYDPSNGWLIVEIVSGDSCGLNEVYSFDEVNQMSLENFEMLAS